MSGSARVALIVGHRGQDGTLLRKRLEADGTKVIGVGRPDRTGQEKTVTPDLSVLAEAERLVRSVRPTEIYYLAAHHGSSETMASEPDATNIAESWSTHVTGFENLLYALEDCGESVQIALASSCLIYAPSDHPIDENASLQPDSVYGVTKAAAVSLARQHRRQGVSVFTAVLFPHESGLRKETFIASKIVRAGLRIAAGSDEQLVISDLESTVDWSMAYDVVSCLVELVRTGVPDDYVFASGRANTIREFVESVSRQLGIPLLDRVDIQPANLLRPHVPRFGDPSRLMSVTSWRPDPNIDAFVQRLIESHRTRL